ncbi:MAG: hypothetical protein IM628_10655 [Phenylobacterium sp.]|uniref:hypothetical protein n=1 Tax=Phenylobacterium sp. TaxID=1871053 RepID=UPI0025F9CF23|nr:hypothetical protein [Phenylobacterium sp.]MCA6305261.1 hypothetical protein [Phenylobacterium sp.]
MKSLGPITVTVTFQPPTADGAAEVRRRLRAMIDAFVAPAAPEPVIVSLKPEALDAVAAGIAALGAKGEAAIEAIERAAGKGGDLATLKRVVDGLCADWKVLAAGHDALRRDVDDLQARVAPPSGAVDGMPATSWVDAREVFWAARAYVRSTEDVAGRIHTSREMSGDRRDLCAAADRFRAALAAILKP